MADALVQLAEELGLDDLTLESDTVDLEDKGLTEIPLAICELQSVEELFLDSNQLSVIPPELVGMVALRELNARNNTLVELPPNFGELKVSSCPSHTGLLPRVALRCGDTNRKTAPHSSIPQHPARASLLGTCRSS